MPCAHLLALARAARKVLEYKGAPDPLRRKLRKFVRKLRKDLPPEAIREIEAAEAEATIKAADYLRRGTDS
jgi:hypothetical protein